MVISHKHKYLFVALPLTASIAISHELRENYDGSFIINHHATYLDFLKIATEDEKNYFVFSGIRNPLDQAVSSYLKYKTDHERWYTDPEKLKQSNFLIKYRNMTRFNFIRKNDPDFAAYFLKHHKIPYDNWSRLSHQTFDFIIRFENLQDDFAKALELIGIEQKRLLPVVNKTNKKDKDFLSYYTPETIPRAKRVFGPFMKKWGYDFPPEWGDTPVPWWNEMELEIINIFRVFYWKYLRSRI